MIIEAKIATTQIVERILLQCRKNGIEYEAKLLADLRESDFHHEVLPLFVRCGDPLVRYWVEFLNIIKVPYIYYVDDNFWMLDGDSALANYYRHNSIRAALDAVVTNASLVITNTENLSNFLAPFNHKRVVLPAPFDFSLLPARLDGRRANFEWMDNSATHEFRIGFAGSPSRIADVENILLPVVRVLLQRYSNLVFEFIGVELKELKNNPRVRFFLHMDGYAEFLDFKISRNWEIGLAPLPDTAAHRAKTNNKYREYSACGIAGIYSAVEPYLLCVDDGKNGILVENTTDAWCFGISRLINSPELLENIKKSSQLDVLEKYAVDVVAPKWLAVFCEEYEASKSQGNIFSLPTRVRLLGFKFYLWSKLVAAQIQVTYKDEGAMGVFRRGGGRVFRFIFH